MKKSWRYFGSHFNCTVFLCQIYSWDWTQLQSEDGNRSQAVAAVLHDCLLEFSGMDRVKDFGVIPFELYMVTALYFWHDRCYDMCISHDLSLSLSKYLSQFQQTLSTLSIYIRWFANIRAFACQILHHVGTSSTPGQNVAFPHICNSIFLTKCPSLNPNNSGQPKWIVCRSIVSSCCVRRRQARGSEPMGPMQNKNLSMNFVEGSCRPRRWIFQGLKLAWFCVAEVWIKRKYKMLWGGEVPWTFVSTFYISHSSVMWLQDHGLRFCSMLQSLFPRSCMSETYSTFERTQIWDGQRKESTHVDER